jgi:hypothetical protein
MAGNSAYAHLRRTRSYAATSRVARPDLKRSKAFAYLPSLLTQKK